jgi:hypothetical protein
MRREISLPSIPKDLFMAHLKLAGFWEICPEVSPANIDLSKIKEIVAGAWGVDPSRLIGKINHTNEMDKVIKTSFCFATYFYSEKGIAEIANLMQCTQKYVSRSPFHFFGSVYHGRKGIQKQHIEILEALNKLLPGRLWELLKQVDFLDKTRPVPFRAPENISLKDKDWFQYDLDIACYHPNYKTGYRTRITYRQNRDWYYHMQMAGFRFEAIQADFGIVNKPLNAGNNLEKYGLQNLKKICSHCEYNARCPMRTEGYEGYEKAQKVGLIEACPYLRDSRNWLGAQLLPDFLDPNLKGYYGISLENIERDLKFRSSQN